MLRLGAAELMLPPESVERLVAQLRELLREEPTAGGLPTYLSLREAAEYLGWPPKRLHNLVGTRRIPFHREEVGCKITFRRDDLDRFMASLRVEPE